MVFSSPGRSRFTYEQNVFHPTPPPPPAGNCELSYTQLGTITEPASENNPLAGTVWIVETGGVLKVTTAEGQLLFEIPNLDNVRAVALDEQRSLLWLVTNDSLSTYN